MLDLRKKITGKARKIVVKLGSSVLVGRQADSGTSGVRESVLTSFATDICRTLARDREVVIVSSGSLAMGMKALGLLRRPSVIPQIQAVTAVGQQNLMALYSDIFSVEKKKVAQVLLTHDDLSNRKRFLNARNTLLTLLGLGVVPIINENDTVAVEEIKFGDNDALSALVTNLVEADLLIILTDIDGLFDTNPNQNPDARRIPIVKDVDHLKPYGFGTETNRFGTGGIVSKIEAARKAAHFGVSTIVANGFEDNIVSRILSGEDLGTLFLHRKDRLTSKKHWMAFSTRPSGTVRLDEGARLALLDGGKSLLPAGITEVEGHFDSGEVIFCIDAKGKRLARGITNYSSVEIDRIMGRNTNEIEEILGYKVYDEVIHRDNLVLI